MIVWLQYKVCDCKTRGGQKNLTFTRGGLCFWEYILNDKGLEEHRVAVGKRRPPPKKGHRVRGGAIGWSSAVLWSW